MQACGRERSKSATSTRGLAILCQKECYLSVSQARPMLTMGVVRSGLAFVTHDETRVKSSCFHQLARRDKLPSSCTTLLCIHSWMSFPWSKSTDWAFNQWTLVGGVLHLCSHICGPLHLIFSTVQETFSCVFLDRNDHRTLSIGTNRRLCCCRAIFLVASCCTFL